MKRSTALQILERAVDDYRAALEALDVTVRHDFAPVDEGVAGEAWLDSLVGDDDERFVRSLADDAIRFRSSMERRATL